MAAAAQSIAPGWVLDNGSLIFNHSDAVTVSSQISGSGSLTQTGTGILTLGSQSNSYSGGTTVSAGTLEVPQYALPAGTPVTVNGVLKLDGNSEYITVLSGSGTIDQSGYSNALQVDSGNFSGTIQDSVGTLALLKTGTDQLILSGSNTYSGGTTVDDGTLCVTSRQRPAQRVELDGGGRQRVAIRPGVDRLDRRRNSSIRNIAQRGTRDGSRAGNIGAIVRRRGRCGMAEKQQTHSVCRVIVGWDQTAYRARPTIIDWKRHLRNFAGRTTIVIGWDQIPAPRPMVWRAQAHHNRLESTKSVGLHSLRDLVPPYRCGGTQHTECACYLAKKAAAPSAKRRQPVSCARTE